MLEEAPLVGWIDPGARHHFRTIERTNVLLVRAYQRVDDIAGDQPFFHEERLERHRPRGRIRQGFGVMPMVVVTAHTCSLLCSLSHPFIPECGPAPGSCPKGRGRRPIAPRRTHPTARGPQSERCRRPG